MKIENVNNEIEQDVMQEESFAIEDNGMIIQILRDKIYSNKIRAVVQEYLCNARDSHRAIGQTKKIKVSVPNTFDPNWRCRDFGASITPENMSKIFIRYGASTKRDTNEFTGGFGIGCKTGFSYGSGSFSVNTFIDGVKRSYNCFIDDTRRGKLVLMSETETDEPNGTEIVVPVNKEDRTRFCEETAKAIQFWSESEKPDYPVADLSDSVPKYEQNQIVGGSDWFISGASDGNNRTNIAVVDGIQYPIPWDSYNHSISGSKVKLNIFGIMQWRSTLVLKFNTGELPVSANREAIELTEDSIASLVKRLQKVGDELKQALKDKINACPTYNDAVFLYAELKQALYIQGFEWHGKPIVDATSELGKGSEIVTYDKDPATGKLIRTVVSRDSFYLPKTKPIIIWATKAQKSDVTPTELRVTIQKILDKHPGEKEVYFITTDTASQKIHLLTNLENFYKFSEHHVPTVKKTRKPSELAKLRFNVYRLYNGFFQVTSLETFMEDENPKVWVEVAKDYSSKRNVVAAYNSARILPADKLNYGIVDSMAQTVLGHPKVSIYGFTVPEDATRLEETVDGVMHLKELYTKFIEKKGYKPQEIAGLKNLSQNYNLGIDFSGYRSRGYYAQGKKTTYVEYLIDKFKGTFFAEYLGEIKKIHDTKREVEELFCFIQFFDGQTEDKISAKHLSLIEKVYERYPLLRRTRDLESYNYDKTLLDDQSFKEYIIMCDEKHERDNFRVTQAEVALVVNDDQQEYMSAVA